jgi:hypothetical protein
MDWHDNVISVSTLTERFEELRDEREALADEESLEEWDREEYGEEYKILGEALEEMRGYGGNYKWEGNYYPDSLIAKSHFPRYAKECARACTATP